jgi:hypothetical protein
MFKPIRVVATILLIASIVLVFIGAFVLGSEVSYSHSCQDISSFVSVSITQSCYPSSLMKYVVFVIIQFLAYTYVLPGRRRSLADHSADGTRCRTSRTRGQAFSRCLEWEAENVDAVFLVLCYGYIWGASTFTDVISAPKDCFTS